MAPQERFELPTLQVEAACSDSIELLGHMREPVKTVRQDRRSRICPYRFSWSFLSLRSSFLIILPFSRPDLPRSKAILFSIAKISIFIYSFSIYCWRQGLTWRMVPRSCIRCHYSLFLSSKRYWGTRLFRSLLDSADWSGVSDGVWFHNLRGHNAALYQLSYRHMAEAGWFEHPHRLLGLAV